MLSLDFLEAIDLALQISLDRLIRAFASENVVLTILVFCLISDVARDTAAHVLL